MDEPCPRLGQLHREISKGSEITNAMEKDKKELEILSKYLNRTVENFYEYFEILLSLQFCAS